MTSEIISPNFKNKKPVVDKIDYPKSCKLSKQVCIFDFKNKLFSVVWRIDAPQEKQV